MSTRTIIEINHDYLYNWENHPAEAAKLLMAAVTGSGHQQQPLDLDVFGIRLIAQRHHADELTVKVSS